MAYGAYTSQPTGFFDLPKDQQTEIADILWASAFVAGPKGCLHWVKELPSGYGEIKVGKKWVLAHRLALELFLGRSIEIGKFSLHRCNNPICIHPFHLYEGTQFENMQDASKAGHLNNKGVKNPRATLNPERVANIRAEYVPFVVTQQMLADKHNVSRQLISEIIRGGCWEEE
jgi:hypothetical protein